MSNKAVLVQLFETGDVPTGANFADLINSSVNLFETNPQTMLGALNPTELVTSRVSAGNGVFTGDLLVNGTITQTNISCALLSANAVYADAIYTGTSFFNIVSANTLCIGSSASFGLPSNAPSVTIDASSGDISTTGTLSVGKAVSFIKAGANAFAINGQSNFSDTATFTNIIVTNNLDQLTGTAQFTNVSAQNVTVVSAVITNFTQPVVTIAASGVAIGTANILTGAQNRLISVSDGTATGVGLQANRTGLIQYLYNETAVSANLWPCVGGQINNLASGAAFAVAAKTLYTIIHIKASGYAVK